MQEQCGRTCGSCKVTEVLFPRPSIAKPDFSCGTYDVTLSTFSRQKRQLGNILGGILGSVGSNRPSPGVNNRPAIPNFNTFPKPQIPSFVPRPPIRNPSPASFIPRSPTRIPSPASFIPRPPNTIPSPASFIPRPPIRNPSPASFIPRPPSPPTNFLQPGRIPFRPSITPVLPSIIPNLPNRLPSVSIPSIFQGVSPIISQAASLLPSFNPFQTSKIPGAQDISITGTQLPAAPAATPVGGGTNADTPSVGIVLVVDTSRPTTQPTQFPVVPRPTIVQAPPPFTVRPVGSTPIPSIVRPITPTPVTQPIQVTSDVIPLSIGSETLDDAICGSVPITDRFLLSAAHCFSNQSVSYRIRLGELDLSQLSESNSRPQDVDVERIFIHPGYSHSSGVRYNDIALLKTVQQIRFSRQVFPFCVLPKPMDITGAPVTVAGFGLVNGTYRSPVLQAAELKGLSDALCQETYKRLGYELALRNRYPNLLVGKGVLCASTPGKSACQGDSGGPLTIKDRNGKEYLLGVVSIGASCLGNSLSVLPGLYTDVAFHIDWINEVLYGS
ncbi:serine proteinase stubble-like [Palaemon carinicauda]|uniref:serine proteinase stubble-like n=1 Tax=Palaemon carinicauda TaxID=392227 RepID=UPI0035B664EB